MDAVTLARLQFGITTVYHFFFVPLTLGLPILVAIMETVYARTGNEVYKRMTKFWGKLLVINFAVGVVTGIVLEFQFGMNWSEYARFMGDIFGVPLATEALSSFFLESTFLGVWIFGWNKLPKGLHTATMWLVALGSNLSGLWILIANSFMQQPVGYALVGGRAQLTDFGALITNPNIVTQYPHVLTSGIVTAAFFIMGISAHHLLKRSYDQEAFWKSFRIGAVAAIIGSVLVILVGHAQTQHIAQSQPMKMAALEALVQSEDPASFSLFSIVRQDGSDVSELVAIRIPAVLSFLTYNRFSGEVRGIEDIQAEYAERFGHDNYVPPVMLSYFTFRIMVGVGFLLVLLALVAVILVWRRKVEHTPLFLKVLIPAIGLPYIANTAGWLLTEMGRQPWIVYGLQKTKDAISPAVTPGMLAFSLLFFTSVYGGLMVADIYLLIRFAKRGTAEQEQAEQAALTY
ncbi:MAG: cytochrome ubiquinol oxidase subunit I [Anaerolineae bacterium]